MTEKPKQDSIDLAKKTGMSIIKQSTLWIRFALVFPIISLLIFLLINILDMSNWYDWLLVFVVAAVGLIVIFWWCWAVFTTFKYGKILVDVSENLLSVQEELESIKKSILKRNK